MKRVHNIHTETEDVRMEATSAFFHRRVAKTPAGTAVVSNIAFQSHVINVHPMADPREPRTLPPEQEEKKEKEDVQSKCCWPFNLCCG